MLQNQVLYVPLRAPFWVLVAAKKQRKKKEKQRKNRNKEINSFKGVQDTSTWDIVSQNES